MFLESSGGIPEKVFPTLDRTANRANMAAHFGPVFEIIESFSYEKGFQLLEQMFSGIPSHHTPTVSRVVFR